MSNPWEGQGLVKDNKEAVATIPPGTNGTYRIYYPDRRHGK